MKLRWVAFWSFFALIVAVGSTVIYREQYRKKELNAYIQARGAKKAQLDDKISRAAERVEFLKTAEGQAWLARDELNMALPGEKIYRFDQGKDAPLPAPDESTIILH